MPNGDTKQDRVYCRGCRFLRWTDCKNVPIGRNYDGSKNYKWAGNVNKHFDCPDRHPVWWRFVFGWLCRGN